MRKLQSRRYLTGIAIATSVLVAAAGCGSSTKTASPASNGGSSSPSGTHLKVAYMVPGTLGDLGFFDSGERGIKKVASTLGDKTTTVEGGANATSTWVRDLQGLSNGSWNVIVTGSAQVPQQLQQVAQQFPKQHYIMFDDTVALPNVASINYRSNDGAFLAGALAALVADAPGTFPKDAGASKTVGIVGGQTIPVIQDFVVGFEKGAKLVDPSIKVLTSYVGSFTDPQTAYNQAQDMYHRGAAVVFAAAGGSGLGVLKASNALNRYSIGVDSNQNATYPKNVLASDLKQVDNSVFDLVNLAQKGKLAYGKTYIYGLQNNGVALVENDALVPAAIRNKLTTYDSEVKSGKVTVPCVNPYCATTGSATPSSS